MSPARLRVVRRRPRRRRRERVTPPPELGTPILDQLPPAERAPFVRMLAKILLEQVLADLDAAPVETPRRRASGGRR